MRALILFLLAGMPVLAPNDRPTPPADCPDERRLEAAGLVDGQTGGCSSDNATELISCPNARLRLVSFETKDVDAFRRIAPINMARLAKTSGERRVFVGQGGLLQLDGWLGGQTVGS